MLIIKETKKKPIEFGDLKVGALFELTCSNWENVLLMKNDEEGAIVLSNGKITDDVLRSDPVIDRSSEYVMVHRSRLKGTDLENLSK